MNTLFLGSAALLAAAGGFWTLRSGTPRPRGTAAVGALLFSLAAAFATYSPLVEDAIESVIPHIARLVSNAAALAAATSILSIAIVLNDEPEQVRRRIRRRLALLAVALLGMTTFFVVESILGRSPVAYAAYLVFFLSYLGFALCDLLRQSVRQARASRRRAVRIGMWVTAAGCTLALVYAGYKVVRMVDLATGLGIFPERQECTSLLGYPCVFAVTVPAAGVLLVCLGLTVPAVAYPLEQLYRRRWERRAVAALEPLWADLTTALPDIVLTTVDLADQADSTEFVLQRRVVEINDGILALRPYRSAAVRRRVAQTAATGTLHGAARVEGALIADALNGFTAGRQPEAIADILAAHPRRRDDLRSEAEWLMLVAASYADHREPRVESGEVPAQIGNLTV